MYQGIWTSANVLLIAGSIIYIWFFHPLVSTMIIISRFLAQIALVLFIFNINMYFIFLLIRKIKQRDIKVWLASLASFMKWHIKIAITSTILIIGHSGSNLSQIGPAIGYGQAKLLMGYLSFLFLLVTLLAGYLRHKKASGFRKRFHRTMAMIFTVLFLIHMLFPV
ncbi:hypothetical protein [Neobacillus sp. Marseille-QA0830]